jgi:hypothetical protein
MTWFEIRVELHGCDDYVNIHDEMRQVGATRTITSDDGQEYQLPRATYFYECGWTDDPTDVRNFLGPKVAEAWSRFSLLVTRTDSLAWQGLEPVVQAPVLPDLLAR